VVANAAAELTGYLAPDGFLPELEQELGSAVTEVHGRLVLARTAAPEAAWAENVWYAPIHIPVSSISDAAKKLRVIQRNWALYSCAHHRRAALIAAKLPKVSAKPIVFGAPAPSAPLGSWTLIAPDMVLASPACARPFPHGEASFVEDRSAPSRAYLKLWELFTLLGVRPRPGALCVDLGASPGGWTWVLQRLGAHVTSIDKAALDPRLAGLAGITYRRQSAFALEPQAVGPVEWLFCDVVCYPKRLLALVQKWLGAGTVGRFVCTLKFQGATDFDTMRAFATIPDSRLLHLHHNKHELTWIHPESRFRAAEDER
jgi:23S rRNA (cytidine2498-2'-O)-methyltransferase